MKTTINQRLKILLDLTYENYTDFAKLYGSSRAHISGLVSRKGNIGRKTLEKVMELIPEVNPEWLLYDIPPMFKPGMEPKIGTDGDKITLVESKGVPIFDIPVMGGNVEVYTDMSHSKPVGYVNIPGYLDCDFCLPVYGDSMYPMYKNGSFIICKWVPKDHKINWGRIYYIEWDNYREVKILVRGDNDEDIELHSLNDQKVNGRLKYHPVTIKHKEVRRIALVKGGFLKDSH